MNKNWALLFVLACFMSSCALNIEKRHALYGERMDKWMVQDRTVRVFLDKDGLYYPEMYISDKELMKLNGSLREWYHHNPAKLSQLYRKYSVDSTGDMDYAIDRLNDAIVKTHTDAINVNMQHFSTVNVLIHGHRKKAYGSFPGITRSSRKDNQKLAGSLTLGTYRHVLYVEVYWDGYFFGIGHNSKEMANAFQNHATPNALNAGLSLRKLLTKIERREINIVTHNLGALVASEALFNASAGILPTALAGEAGTNTPSKNPIKLCMIAPAIGADLFKNYSNRTPDSIGTGDNYELSVVYNEYDLATRKIYKGILLSSGHSSPTENGNTSLGCNHDRDVAKMINNVAPAKVDTFDFSRNGGKKSNCQFLNGCYLKNEVKFQAVAEYLGDKKADEEAYTKEMLKRNKNLKGAAKRAYEAKMREEARRQLEAKRLEDAKQRDIERKQREIERKEADKQRAKERAQATAERKAAEKERMDAKMRENKEKAIERDKALKEREVQRKIAEKEKAVQRDQMEAQKRIAEKEKAAEKRRMEDEKANMRRNAEKEKAAEKRRMEDEKRAAEKEKAAEKRRMEDEKRAAEREKEAAEKAAEKAKRDAEKESKKK